MKLSDLTLDVNKVDEGVWRDVPGDEDGFRVLIRGRRSDAYKKAQGKAMRATRRSLGRNQERLMDHVTRIDNECIAKHCLLGWERFFDAKGKEIPYSEEFSKELMTERRYEPFQEIVKDLIDELDSGFQEAEDDVVEKS